MEYNVDLYDGLDIFQENPLTLILKQIRPRSSVLEFGPAYGRMTRYLKEKLNCNITCVEINLRAEESLRQFADMVIIGDIESGEWTQQIAGKAFDYIVFADILEHLAAPEQALAAAIPFLKDSGRVFISVPNIAHNAVIEGLYADQFEYQESGILDKTHLRFFTRNSLQKLIEQTGLSVLDRQATHYTNEMTGILKKSSVANTELRELLKNRENPDVYQLVYTAGRAEQAGQGEKGDSEEAVPEQSDGMDSVKIYLDTGDGFSEKTAYEKKYDVSGGEIYLELEFPKAVSVNRVRIDPSNSSCICEIKELVFISADGKQDEITADRIVCENILRYENVFIFSCSDPQMTIPDPQIRLKAVRISLAVTYIAHRSSRLYTLLYALIDERTARIGQLQNQLKNVEGVSEQRAQKSAELECRLAQVEKEAEERATKNAELMGVNELLKRESEDRARKIAELQRRNELIKEESEERAAKSAELMGANKLLKEASEDRANKIAELLSVNEKIFLESQERSVRIAQLEFLLTQLEKESSEWAQKIEYIEDDNRRLSRLVIQKNQEIFRKNRLILENSDIKLKQDFKIPGSIKDKNV